MVEILAGISGKAWKWRILLLGAVENLNPSALEHGQNHCHDRHGGKWNLDHWRNGVHSCGWMASPSCTWHAKTMNAGWWIRFWFPWRLVLLGNFLSA